MTWLTMPPLSRILKGVAAAWLLASLPVFTPPAHANNWGEMAMVSATMGISDSRICIGEGSRGDLGCPSYAPTISPTGRINASAGLTVDSVSLTTTGTTWGYLGSGASYLPNFASNAVSASNISASTINGIAVSAFAGNGSFIQKSMSTSSWGAVQSGIVPLNTVANANGGRITSSGNQVTLQPGSSYLMMANLRGTSLSTGTMMDYYITDIAGNVQVGQPGNIGEGSGSDTSAWAVVRPTIAATYEVRMAGVAGSGNIDGNGSKFVVIELSVGGNGSVSGTGVTALSALTDVTLTSPATGQVLTYNGTRWVNSSGASGDRLTSGTLAVTANSATSIVNLSTNGTTWGYLGSSQSYLPNLTAAQVSATAISTTAVQIASTTTVTACTATNAGTLRYNSTNTALELCTGSGWQVMGVGIPAGTISAFASTTCPTGWSEYTPARGRFLRGIDNGAGNDPSGLRVPGNVQEDAFQTHQHFIVNDTAGQDNVVAFADPNGDSTYANGGNTGSRGDAYIFVGNPKTGRFTTETRPKNVAVTFCQFNGTSNGWNNPLSGGSTVPGGNTGQIQFNSAGAFAGSAGLTWDNAASRLTATNISATSLTVNGVAITGSSSGDRITSGTTSMIANPSGTIEVNGGIRLMSATTAPVCTAATAGTIARINGKTYECRM